MPSKPKPKPKPAAAPAAKPKRRNAAKFTQDTGPMTLRFPLDTIAEIRAAAKARFQTPSQYLAQLHQQNDQAEAPSLSEVDPPAAG